MDVTFQFDFLKKNAQRLGYLHGFAVVIDLFLVFLFPNSDLCADAVGYLAVVLSLYPFIQAIRLRRLHLVLNCISLFNFAPVWFLYLEGITPGYDAHDLIDPEYRMKTFIWISIFLVSINFFYILLWNAVTRRSVRFFAQLFRLNLSFSFFEIGAFLTFFVPMIFFKYYYGSTSALWEALTAGRSSGGGSGLLKRGSVGDASSLLLPINWLWQLVPLFGTLAFVEGKVSHRIRAYFAIGLAFVVVFFTFLGGSRGGMMLVAAPMIFFLFYYNLNKGIKFWLLAGVLMVTVVGIMELQVRFRGGLLDVIKDPAAAAKAKGLESATTFDVTESQRDNNLYLLCLMIKSYPNKYEFEGLNDYFAIILNPVPRALWAGKPLLGGAKGIGNQHQFVLDGPRYLGTTSLTTSVVGNAYIAGGVFGIIVYAITYSLFLLWFDGLIYYTTKADKPLIIGIFGIGVFLSFWGFRGFFALVGFLYPIMFLVLSLKLLKRK